MSLFKNDKKPCPICGSPTPKIFPTKIEDLPICKECDNKISMENKQKDDLTLDKLREHLAYRQKNAELHSAFCESRKVSTGMFGSTICIDDEQKLWYIAEGENSPIFRFDELTSYLLREDNSPIERGAAGGRQTYPGILQNRALYDITDSMQRLGDSLGRINGSRNNTASASHPAEQQMQAPIRNVVLEIEVSNTYWKERMLTFGAPGLFDNDIRRFYVDYQNKLAEINEFTQALFSFFPGKPAVNTAAAGISVADELKKFKELLDMGAITQSEFDLKKKELLNL